MNKILLNYLLKNFLKTLMVVILVIYCFGLILNLFEEIEFFKNIEVDILMPLMLTSIFVPSMIIKLLPFIIFVSSMWFMVKIRNNKDLLTLKVYGYSNIKIFSILALTSFLFGWIVLVIISPITSSMVKYYEKTKSQYARDIDHLVTFNNNGLWIKENLKNGDRIITAKKPEGFNLIDVTIFHFKDNYNLHEKIYAQNVNIKTFNWALDNVTIFSSKNGVFEKKKHENYTLNSNYNYEKITSLFNNSDTISFLNLAIDYENLLRNGYNKRFLNQSLHTMLSLPFFLFLMTGLAIIFYLNQDSPQPRERDYSYVASFMTFSIWISLGIYGSINFICDKFLEKSIKIKATNFMLILFLLFMPTRMLLANYDTHDRTGNYIAWDMAYNMLQTCEPNAILFTNGDNDTFPLWYLQEVEKIRTDVVVANLSLLNTPWYIEQLKSRYKDKPFIKMNENEITNLDFKRWETKEVSINAPRDENNQSGKIEWSLKPTYMDIALRIQDLMVLKIINDNNWDRPIYFAVTVSPVSMLSLDEYLRMDGLAYKLVNNKNEIVNKKIISKNLLEFIGKPSWFTDYDSNKNIIVEKDISKEYQSGYLYRNLSNKEVYIEPQIGRLIQNYRTGFARLSISYYLDEDLENSEKVLLEMENIMPSSIIPFPSKDLQYQIAQVYNGVGNKEKMKYHMKELIERKDLKLDDYILYGKTFIQSLEEYEESELIFETIYNNYNIIENSIKRRGYTSTKISPSEWNNWQESLAEIVFLLYISYKEQKKYEKAEALLSDWIEKNPKDENALKMLEEIIELKNK